MPVSQHHTVSDLPLWLWLLVGFAGLSGEMWRADVAGVTFGELVKRIALRWCASATFGMCILMIAMAHGAPLFVAGGLAGITACNGADIASGIYNRWLKHRLGLKHDEPA